MKDKLYLIIAGSRLFTDYELFRGKCDHFLSNYLEFDTAKNRYNPKIQIISGCARGPDEFAIIYAAHKFIEVKRFPADWNKYGRGAGPIRNKQMLDYILQFENNGLLAFWDSISRGTMSMINLIKDAGVNTKVVTF